MGRRHHRFMGPLAAGLAVVLGAGLLAGPAGIASAAPAARDASVDVSKLVSISPINLDAGARRIGLAASQIFAQSTREGTLNVTLSGPQPFARIVPVTGEPYFVSAGDLAQYFSALLGPAPTIGISYGAKDRQRSINLTQSVSPPVYDVSSQTVTFQAVADMEPFSGSRALVTFVATDPAWRGGQLPDRTSMRSRAYRDAQADAAADYILSTDVNNDLGAATAPSRLLSATQQVFSGPTCVTYGNVGATGGSNTTTSSLKTMSTSTSVSQTVNAGASVSMKYGGLKTSIGGSYTGTSGQDSASVYAVAEVKSSGMTTNLTPTLIYNAAAITGLDKAVQMIGDCGDSVATSYSSGSIYQAVLQMKTASQEQAQTLQASLSASYSTPGTSTSGSASFAGTVASSSSVSQVSVNEMCVGPVYGCSGVTGYHAIDTTNVSTALDSFSNNYAAMSAGLASQCLPTTAAGSCVFRLHYVPIENIISGTISNSAAAKTYVSQASTGVYWMLTNAMTWANGYQSLATAYTTAAQFTEDGIYSYGSLTNPLTADQLRTQAADYQSTATSLLTWAGTTCGGSRVGSGSASDPTSCLSRMIACAQAATSVSGSTAAACLPSTFISGLADPTTLSGPSLVYPPTTCDEAVPSARSMGNYNQVTTLYLSHVQAVSFPVWCVWTSGAVTTYLKVTGTSRTDLGTTTYSYAQFDPATWALYALPTSYPGNTPIQLKPTCSWDVDCLSPAPLGYAETGKGFSNHGFSVTLPSNLAFGTTTVYYGTGSATLTNPASVGLRSNVWSVNQGGQGTALLSDAKYQTAGITLLVPSNSKYTFTPTTGVSVQSADPNKSCLMSASGKASNSGIASTQSSPTDSRNQQVWFSGSLDGNPQHCKVWLKETSYKHHGSSNNPWTDGTWYVNSEWGPLYPTFICGYSTEGNGDLRWTANRSDPSSMSVKFQASTASNRDPTLTVWIQFDNVNTPLSGSNVAAGGMCDENSNNTNMPIDGHIEY